MRRLRVGIIPLFLWAMLAMPPVCAQNAAAPPAPATTGASAPAPAATVPPSPFAQPPEALLPDVPADPEKTEVSIAFARADLVSVLGFLSLASGVPVIVDADVKGTVTISSMRKVPLTLAYEAINAALRVRGYTMIGTLRDKMIRVVTLKKAIADRATVQFGADINKIGTGDAMITQVIPVQFISATKLKDELKPLVADDQANLLAISSTNTLIVTDTEGNVRRLTQIINMLDTDSTDVLEMEVYPCKYASASVLINSLEKLFGIGSYAATPTAATGAAQPNRPGMPAGNNPRGGPGGTGTTQPTVSMDGDLMSLKGELHLAADERTNSIIISAAKAKITLVLNLVKKLDINTTSEVRARVFRLQFADATMVTNQLNTMFEQPQGGNTATGGAARFFRGNQGSAATSMTASDYAGLKRNIIVADVRTNSVVVTATEQNLKDFEALIKELDVPNILSDVARSFPLKYAKATTVATTLTQLFRGSSSNRNFFDVILGNTGTAGDPITSLRNITVVAFEKTNSLLITGPPQTFTMIENIIRQLDQRTPQVFIQVAIVDVTLDDTTKFGIDWLIKSGKVSPDGKNPRSSVGTDFGLTDEKYGLKYSVISDNLQVLLHALTTDSNVKVYSTPSITTADNVAATISIGQDIPFVSSSEETSGGNFRQTVDFKNVSITLNVTPHVTDATNLMGANLIGLDVQQTINELIGREIELNAPIIANRQAKTTVMVKDGQTIVIGGIIKDNIEKSTKAVPLLSKIPVLGEAFKSRSNTVQKSELMVFITPHVLRDDESVDTRRNLEINKLSEPVPPSVLTPDAVPAPAAK